MRHRGICDLRGVGGWGVGEGLALFTEPVFSKYLRQYGEKVR
jgi:hypothetical protein